MLLAEKNIGRYLWPHTNLESLVALRIKSNAHTYGVGTMHLATSGIFSRQLQRLIASQPMLRSCNYIIR
jgi:hypothetical protein